MSLLHAFVACFYSFVSASLTEYTVFTLGGLYNLIKRTLVFGPNRDSSFHVCSWLVEFTKMN